MAAARCARFHCGVKAAASEAHRAAQQGAREFVFVVAGEQLAMLDGSMQVFPKGGFAYLLDFETSAPDATWQTVTRTGTMSGRVLCFPVAD